MSEFNVGFCLNTKIAFLFNVDIYLISYLVLDKYLVDAKH
jgi:hypothetical protein